MTLLAPVKHTRPSLYGESNLRQLASNLTVATKPMSGSRASKLSRWLVRLSEDRGVFVLADEAHRCNRET